MATKKTKRRKPAVRDCSNAPNTPYPLWEFLPLLQDKAFAQFFLDLLKRAESNDKAAIDCVNAYLGPTELELQNLGIPASQIDSMRRCTDSGLLVMVTAHQNA
jgi:hypothetical protein